MTTRFGSRIDSKKAPVISGQGGGGTTCPPTFVISETPKRADRLVLNPMRFVDSERRADRIVLNPARFTDSISRVDAYRIPTASITPPETLQRNDLAIFTVNLTAVDRSGTPDSDDWGDAWTDSTIGQTGVNHGNESPLQATGLVTGVKRAYVKINLTRYTGLTATGGAHTFVFKARNTNLVLSSTLAIAMQGQAGNPFTESTITQSNQPAVPTAITRSVTVPAGDVLTTFTLTLTNAEMDQLLGKWALIVFTTADLTQLNNITSREGTAGDEMTLTFKATR